MIYNQRDKILIISHTFSPLNLINCVSNTIGETVGGSAIVYLLPPFCSLFAQNQRAAGPRIIIVRRWLIPWYVEITQGNSPQSWRCQRLTSVRIPFVGFTFTSRCWGARSRKSSDVSYCCYVLWVGSAAKRFTQWEWSEGDKPLFYQRQLVAADSGKLSFQPFFAIFFSFGTHKILVEMSLERILKRSTVGGFVFKPKMRNMRKL